MIVCVSNIEHSIDQIQAARFVEERLFTVSPAVILSKPSRDFARDGVDAFDLAVVSIRYI